MQLEVGILVPFGVSAMTVPPSEGGGSLSEAKEEEEWSRARVEFRLERSSVDTAAVAAAVAVAVLGPTVTVTRERRYQDAFDDGLLYKGEQRGSRSITHVHLGRSYVAVRPTVSQRLCTALLPLLDRERRPHKVEALRRQQQQVVACIHARFFRFFQDRVSLPGTVDYAQARIELATAASRLEQTPRPTKTLWQAAGSTRRSWVVSYGPRASPNRRLPLQTRTCRGSGCLGLATGR